MDEQKKFVAVVIILCLICHSIAVQNTTMTYLHTKRRIALEADYMPRKLRRFKRFGNNNKSEAQHNNRNNNNNNDNIFLMLLLKKICIKFIYYSVLFKVLRGMQSNSGVVIIIISLG